jgi:hypothetical protein
VPSRVWRRVALVALCIVAAAAIYAWKVSPKMADFEVYWRAGVRAAAGESLYRAADGHYQFKYLPAFAVLVAPLTLLGAPVARAVWFALSLAALAGMVGLSVRLWPEWRRPAWLLVVLTLAVMGKFYAHELVLGQTNAMFGAVMVGALLAMVMGHEALAGVLVVLGIVLKPYALLFLPWLVVRQRRASIATAAGGLVVTAVLPLLRYSVADTIAQYREWYHTVRDTTTPNLLSADNVSWLAMYAKWLGNDTPWPWRLSIATSLVVVAMLALMWRVRSRVNQPERLEGSLLLVLLPLVSPQGWDYVLLLATPAVMCLITFADRLDASIRVLVFVAMAVIGLTLYDLIGHEAYRVFMMSSGITVCAFVLLAGLCAVRARQAA